MTTIHRKKRRVHHPFYKRALFRRWLIVFFLLIVLVCLLFFSSLFRCEDILIEGNHVIDGKEIKNFALNVLERNPSLSILWPLNDLAGDLKNNFLYIEEIKISRKWPNAIKIVLKERKMAYCVIMSTGKKILIDQNYFFLEQIENGCPSNLPMIFCSEKQEIILSGGSVFLEEIQKIISGTKETISLFPYLFLTRFEIDKFYVKAMISDTEFKSNWFIYLNQFNDIYSQIRRLELFLRTKTREELISLDYVDVGSHEERVFYADKND